MKFMRDIIIPPIPATLAAARASDTSCWLILHYIPSPHPTLHPSSPPFFHNVLIFYIVPFFLMVADWCMALPNVSNNWSVLICFFHRCFIIWSSLIWFWNYSCSTLVMILSCNHTTEQEGRYNVGLGLAHLGNSRKYGWSYTCRFYQCLFTMFYVWTKLSLRAGILLECHVYSSCNHLLDQLINTRWWFIELVECNVNATRMYFKTSIHAIHKIDLD